MTGYLLDNAHPIAGDRFALLQRLFDPVSIATLSRVSLAAGSARCWEVGTGGGSVANYLQRKAQPFGGSVLATDVDLEHANHVFGIEALVHDVVNDPPPLREFDLIHARLVIQHVEDPACVIDTLVASLRPGGWLVIEELDPMLPYCPDPRDSDGELINRVGAAFTYLLGQHAEVKLGRGLLREFHGRGLRKVTNHGHLFPSVGGSPSAKLMQANIAQFTDELVTITEHPLTRDDLARYVLALDDPATDIMLPVFFSAKGQR